MQRQYSFGYKKSRSDYACFLIVQEFYNSKKQKNEDTSNQLKFKGSPKSHHPIIGLFKK
jgi:hypothetical protein